MTQMLRLALGATVIAAGCGGGDGDGEMNGDGLVSCGDGTCTTSVMLEGQVPEDCRLCPQDCGVCEGCGNGTCDGNLAIGTGENCLSCVEDCACGADQQCFEVTSDGDAICGARMCNGDGTCDAAAGETCQSCADCTECEDPCGDGTCDAEAFEDCGSCEADCGCDAATQVCSEEDASCVSNNPLIEAIPGRWIRVEPNDGNIANVTADPTQPDCGDPSQTLGDACVVGFSPATALVLDGERLRITNVDESWEGSILDAGQRVELTQTFEGGSLQYIYERRE